MQGPLALLALGGSDAAGLWGGFEEGSGVAGRDEAAFRWTPQAGWRTEPAQPGMSHWTLRSIASSAGHTIGLAELVAYGLARTEALRRGARERALVVLEGTGPPPELPAALCPRALLVTPSGDLFAVGERCGTTQTWLHRWPVGNAHGAEQSIASSACPAGEERSVRVERLARRGDEVLAMGTTACAGIREPVLLRQDGATGDWKLVRGDRLAAMLPASADGSVWVDRQGVWRLARDGSLEAIPLPAGWAITAAGGGLVPATSTSAWALGPDDVWAVAHHGAETSILHTGPVAGPAASLPSDDTLVQNVDDASQPVPWSSACASALLVFDGLAPDRASSLDLKPVCAALARSPLLGGAGLTFYETELRGHAQLVAVSNAVPESTATSDAAKLLGDRAHLVCRNPVTRAKWELDCSAGRLVPR